MSNKHRHRLGKHANPDFVAVFEAAQRQLAARHVAWLMSVDELYTLWQGLRNAMALATKIPDTCVFEAGVFQGASAVFLAEALKHFKSDAQLVLADTFTGMPDELIDVHDTWAKGGHKATSVDSVQKLVGGIHNTKCIAGRIPESLAGCDIPANIVFANLDLDLHASTLHALHFVWPRLVPGAWLVCHNYNDKGAITTNGVRQAFEDFNDFFDQSACHQKIEIADTQVLLIK